MRFMIVVKATKDTEAGKMPEEKLFAAMAAYHEELLKAGVLLDATGLQPSSKGWRVKYAGGKRTVIDGPFTEAKEQYPRWGKREERNAARVAVTKAACLALYTESVPAEWVESRSIRKLSHAHMV